MTPLFSLRRCSFYFLCLRLGLQASARLLSHPSATERAMSVTPGTQAGPGALLARTSFPLGQQSACPGRDRPSQ